MDINLMNILFLIIGGLLGFAVAYFMVTSKQASRIGQLENDLVRFRESASQLTQLQEQTNELKVAQSRLQTMLDNSEQHNMGLEERLKEEHSQKEALAAQKNQLEVQLAQQETIYEKAKEQQAKAKEELDQLNEKFTKEFENLANKILDEKSTKFTDQNKKNIEQILNPLQEKIQSFEKKVEETHKDSIEKQGMLRQQIMSLKDLNEQMSKEANNLTKALKGDAKMRGNWGELVLERVLEKSGLTKGSEYDVQQSFKNDKGNTIFPDVIVHLPGGKKMIIDSKVSLNAYERYVNEEDTVQQERYLKEHITALKKHVTDLSAKNYNDIYQIESPDFVLLFVPIEPAFASALNADTSLYTDAFEKNIVIVTPTTLLATLRTIETMWQSEKQQRYALDIANAAGSLYDQFVLLTDDLLKLGNQFTTVKRTYESTMKKLTGRGNLVSKVEKIKSLGAKANKTINQKLITRTEENDPGFLED